MRARAGERGTVSTLQIISAWPACKGAVLFRITTKPRFQGPASGWDVTVKAAFLQSEIPEKRLPLKRGPHFTHFEQLWQNQYKVWAVFFRAGLH